MNYLMDDVERAEYHLNKDQLSRRLSAAGAALLVGTMTLLFSTGAAASALHQSGCGPELNQVHYSATFQWKNREEQPILQYRLVIGTTNPAVQNQYIAQIWSGNECEAICQPMNFEKEGTYAPIAMEMQCKSAQLGTFSSNVTLLWGRGHTQSKLPALRFGTWLQGYEQAALAVELDRYSVPLPTEKAPRKLAAQDRADRRIR